jgi:cysteine desulfurase
MIYLDYSATTKTNEEVLSSFSMASEKYFANPNSSHKLGVEANKLIEASTKQIANILGVKESEIIYTSGSSESNNMAIKMVAYTFKNRGKHIITSEFEHSSIYSPISFLQKEGYEVDFVKTDENGIVDLNDLKSKIRKDTILVTIASVNSEIGIKQPIEEIAKIVSKHEKCLFHVDATQSIGKCDINLKNVDLVSMSAHKFYGIKGIGILIKKENIIIEPLIHGGKSTTKFRSGTPACPLIVSTAKALRLAYEHLNDKYEYVSKINQYLKNELSKYELVRINSNDYCIPHILNLSVLGVKPETMQHALEEYDIYISTQTACSSKNQLSKGVLALTKDKDRASSSIRISLSYLTTNEEIEDFLIAFDKCYKELTNMR